ncbi:retrovirus-related pol polyprotein from transposon TNT 1-94 [Tanacetum coccineum]
MYVAQVAQPQVNPDSTIAQVEHITPFTYYGTGVQRLYNMLHHVSLEGRHIVVLGLRGGLLGANPISHRPRVGQALLQQLVWTDRADGMTEGRKQNRNKSKSWKIGEIKDKEVNMAAGDYDDALVCCVENTIDDRIMDSGASFHATYCKEELESWTLKDVRYIPGLKRRRLISAGQLEEEGYHVGFGDQQWKVTKDSLVVAHGNKRGSLYMVEDWYEHVSFQRQRFRCTERRYGSFFHNVKEDNGNYIRLRHSSYRKIWPTLYLHQSKDLATMILLSSCEAGVAVKVRVLTLETPLQFGVAERLSQTFRVKSTGIRVEASNMLWTDSVKDVCGEAMKCTFIGSGSDEVRYSFWDTKSHQVIQSRDITFVDSIYGARAQVGAQIRVRGPKTVGASRIVEDEMKNTLKMKHPPRREDPKLHRYEDPPESLGLRLPIGKKASQSLWMFRVKEEQDGMKRYKARLVVKSFQQIHRVDYNKIFSLVVKMTTLELVLSIIASEDLHLEKLDVKTAFLHGDLDKDIYMTQPEGFQFLERRACSDVHQVGDEIEIEVLRSFNWPPIELITEDGFLLERACSVCSAVQKGYSSSIV